MSNDVTGNGQSTARGLSISELINAPAQESEAMNPGLAARSPYGQIPISTLINEPLLESAAEVSRTSPSPSASQPTRKAMWVKWSEEENTKLISLRESGLTWNDVSKQMPGRSGGSCSDHCGKALVGRIDPELMIAPARWSKEEDDLLYALREKRVAWKEVAERLPGRTVPACQLRLKKLKSGQAR